MIQRVSITIPGRLLEEIDRYVSLVRKGTPGASRSSVISDVLSRNIPRMPPH